MIIQARRLYRTSGTTLPAHSGYGPVPDHVPFGMPLRRDNTARVLAWLVASFLVIVGLTTIVISYFLLQSMYGQVYGM